jgi:hypothetical protein
MSMKSEDADLREAQAQSLDDKGASARKPSFEALSDDQPIQQVSEDQMGQRFCSG